LSKHILVIDDSATIQKVIQLAFAGRDYELTSAADGEAGLRLARQRRPDLVLLDVVIPGMDGYEVCEAIRADPALQDVPVLLLTGTFETFDQERAERVGADGYLTKPFESEILVQHVRKLLAGEGGTEADGGGQAQGPSVPEQKPVPTAAAETARPARGGLGCAVVLLGLAGAWLWA
jgi:CheY-like chemotaxis protein